MVIRVWRGWTRQENADAYEELVTHEVLPAIAAKGIAGFQHADVLRRDVGEGEAAGEVEFTTHLWFDSLAAVRAMAGDDYRKSYVPEAARALLSRFDSEARHYEMRARVDAGGKIGSDSRSSH